MLAVFAVLSLALLSGVAVLWGRSDRALGGFAFETPGRVRPETPAEGARLGHRLTGWKFQFAGFSLSQNIAFLYDDNGIRNGNVLDLVDVVIPFWPVALFSTISPVLWFFGYRRARLIEIRRATGLCVRCGYDLRASPSFCPECGTTPAATAA